MAGNVLASYTYDGLERMAIRTTQNKTPSGTTHYLYDLSGRLIAEASGSGATVTEYVWVDDLPLDAGPSSGPRLPESILLCSRGE